MGTQTANYRGSSLTAVPALRKLGTHTFDFSRKNMEYIFIMRMNVSLKLNVFSTCTDEIH